jgi:ribosome biogenesis GTPase / thiamine phosphate phosphatase
VRAGGWGRSALTDAVALRTVRRVPDDLRTLGWDATLDEAWASLAPRPASAPGRVRRIDRGWSSLLSAAGPSDEPPAPERVRNLGADVAVGDWVVVSADGERVDRVLPRRSAFVRRASFDGAHAEAQPLAANIDVVFLVHALTSPPNERRLERELVLAYDSGADPVIVLTKADLATDVRASVEALEHVALTVPVFAASGRTGQGLDALAALTDGHRTIALLGASGVGKSTLVNGLVGREVQDTGTVREGDDRGRHTTTAAELVRLPGGGWLIDTPGLRAVSLWASGEGIERAFQDVFDLAEHCRFRDCKHEDEPGCAVRDAVAAGQLDPRRVQSLTRLVAEEAALEEEQRQRIRASDRRGVRRVRS